MRKKRVQPKEKKSNSHLDGDGRTSSVSKMRGGGRVHSTKSLHPPMVEGDAVDDLRNALCEAKTVTEKRKHF